MTLQLKHEVLWLSKKEKMSKPSSVHAILWPAYEYTIMIYKILNAGDSELNPFERAIVGLVEIGCVQIKKQAEILNLHEAFVAHLHTVLVNREILDGNGNLKSKLKRLTVEEKQEAFHMYQDPWSGKLWPQLSSADYRKTMVAEVDDGKVQLIVGTTGDPIEIRAFEVNPPRHKPASPTSDDASSAMSSWFDNEKSGRRNSKNLAQKPLKIFPNSQQLVYLCCPNHRGELNMPRVDDPFGSQSWKSFSNQVAKVAEEQPGLGWWLYGKTDDEETDSKFGDDLKNDFAFTHLRARLIEGNSEYRGGDKTQVRLDLIAMGHESIDRIWENRTQDHLPLLLDSQNDFDLTCSLAIAIGFETKGLNGASDLSEICASNSGSLSERCSALLLGFRSDLPNVMHQLAEQCPNIFFLLEDAESGHDTTASDLGLVNAVEALVNASKFAAEVV